MIDAEARSDTAQKLGKLLKEPKSIGTMRSLIGNLVMPVNAFRKLCNNILGADIH
jgi:hypothetical protein